MIHAPLHRGPTTPLHIYNRVLFSALHFRLSCRPFQLLEEHPSLKRFKSTKKTVRVLKRVGDVLTIVVVAGMFISFIIS